MDNSTHNFCWLIVGYFFRHDVNSNDIAVEVKNESGVRKADLFR